MWTVPYNNNILNSKHYKLFTWWFLKICLCSVFLVSATFAAPQLSVTSNQTHLNVTVSPPMAAWNCSIENSGFWGKDFLKRSVKYTVCLTHPESLAGKVIIPASPSVVIRIHVITLLFYVLVALSIYTVCGNVSLQVFEGTSRSVFIWLVETDVQYCGDVLYTLTHPGRSSPSQNASFCVTVSGNSTVCALTKV